MAFIARAVNSINWRLSNNQSSVLGLPRKRQPLTLSLYRTMPHMMPPRGATRSSVACWWSIKNLIEKYECYFWTLTCPDSPPDYSYGERHRELLKRLRDDARDYGVPPVCGVRVVEAHPGGHGLHYHWVLAGRLPIRRVLARGKQVGFGRISVDSRPCTPAVAPYLCKYLIKGDRLHGVRMWANIGTWDGVGVRDIQVDSDSVRVFGDHYRHARSLGRTHAASFGYAKVQQRKYELNETDRLTADYVSFDPSTGRVFPVYFPNSETKAQSQITPV